MLWSYRVVPDEDDKEAQRIIYPIMENLRSQMTPEELAMFEQQIIARLSAVRDNQARTE